MITVKGPKGTLTRQIHKDMKVNLEEGTILVERPSDNKLHRSLHGTTRSIIANMVSGVTEGFSKTLELVGVGYRASKSGEKIVLNVGYSHPVEIDLKLASSSKFRRTPKLSLKVSIKSS